MSEDQRTAQQWTVRANGVDLKTLKSGESVEIGRKPLRPLPDDGLTRLNVVDINKSMSKRHAVFTVKEQGRAFIRDLNSTNGSYMVSENGQLIKMPTGRDIELPKSPMIVQFGDVKVTFERTEISARATSEHVPAVSNLFEYADSEDKAPEPDLSDMSVDDILNLRSGEPTTLFRARNVAERVDSMKRAEEHSFAPESTTASVGSTDVDESESAKPETAKPESVESETAEPAGGPKTGEPKSEKTKPVELPSVSLVFPKDGATEESPRDLFKDAVVKAAEEATEQESKAAAEFKRSLNALHEDSDSLDVDVPKSSASASRSDTSATVPVDRLFSSAALKHASEVSEQQSKDDMRSGEPEPALRDGSRQMEPRLQAGTQWVGLQETESERPVSKSDERFRRPAEEGDSTNAAATDTTTAIAPVFEPGSVFDRVSKGNLVKQEETVEIDGLTSDEAKRTDDFTVQFQMARHPELLPFLAMNTMLYDDLYAWLEALGDQDIDAALSHNTGYAEYRKATGK